MARKKKIQIEKYPGIPRGAEHGARLTESGAEILSTEPITLRVKSHVITDFDKLRQQIQAIRAHDGPIEFETFQEADDFDIEDDFGDFTSKWEIPSDNPDDAQVTIDEYIRFRTTGELPAKLLPQDSSAAVPGNNHPSPTKAPLAPPVNGSGSGGGTPTT